MSNPSAHPESSGRETVPLRWVRWLCSGYWLSLAVFTHWPRLDLGTPPYRETGLPTDKLLHFGAFGLLCALLIHSRPAGRSAARCLNVVVGCVVVAVYAYVDEFSQVYFEDRIASWSDVWANWVAVLAFLMAGLWGPVNDWRRGRPLFFWRVVLAVVLVVFGVLCVVSPLALRPLRPWMWEFNQAFGKTLGKFDHTGHFVFAMVLTWLLVAARPVGARRFWLSSVICLGLFAGSAPVIERVQVRFERTYESADMRAHYWGIVAGVLIAGGWWLGRWVVRKVLARLWRGGGEGGFVRHATIVSGLTLVSRFTGLARDAVLAAAFGRSAIASAFLIGFLVPNLFRRLFGEGALSSALIPEYSKWLNQDRGTARKLITLTLGGMVVVLGGLTVVGEGVLLGMLHWREWSAASALAIELAMWMLPYMPMVCVVAVLGAVLQVHGRFAAAASAPILLNVCMIVGILWAADGLLSQGMFSDGSGEAGALAGKPPVAPGVEAVVGEGIDPAGAIAMTVVAGSVLIAGLLQLGYVVLPAKDVESLDLDVRGWRGAWGPFKGMMAAFVPMVAGLAVFQFNALLDSLIAMGLSPPEAGKTTFELLGWVIAYPVSDKGQVAALHWAQRLYQFPLGVFGIAIATAVFPALSHAAAVRVRAGDDGEDGAFRLILQRGLRLTVFIGLPASVGLMLVRLPLVRAIFERGEFGLEDAKEVAGILLPYAAAVWAYSMVHVLTRAYYALGDPKTPVRVSLRMAGLNFLMNMVLVWPLGAGGLAWSTAATAMLQCVVLVRGLERSAWPGARGLIDSGVISGWKRSAVATVLMGAGVWLVMGLLGWWNAGVGVWIELMWAVGAGVLVYGGVAWMVGCEEIRWLRGRGVG